MNPDLKEIIIIFIAIALWDGLVLLFQHLRKKEVENALCDVCQKPRKTQLTKDKKHWACRTCRVIYNKENA